MAQRLDMNESLSTKETTVTKKEAVSLCWADTAPADCFVGQWPVIKGYKDIDQGANIEQSKWGGFWQKSSFTADLLRSKLFTGGYKFQGTICQEILLQDEMTGSNEGLMEKMREEEGESLKMQ